LEAEVHGEALGKASPARGRWPGPSLNPVPEPTCALALAAVAGAAWTIRRRWC
jgi:hypothetical protein